MHGKEEIYPGADPLYYFRGVRPVLIACEFSGVIREALRRSGVPAVSCDLLPSELPGPHLQIDVLQVLSLPWAGVIAHPPCTALAVSGARWFKEKRAERLAAEEFFLRFALLKSCPVAVENPVCVMSSIYRKPDQVYQPWQFGEPESKATCLWLHKLPPLFPTRIETIRRNSVRECSPSPDRWKFRSRTLPGVAAAMASQWGPIFQES